MTIYRTPLGALGRTPQLGALRGQGGARGVLVLDLIGTAGIFTDTGATIPATIGNSVAAWRDETTPTLLATQGTAGAQPTAAAAGLAFDGGDFVSGNAALRGIEAGQPAITIYSVVALGSLGVERTIFVWSLSNATGVISGRKVRLYVSSIGEVNAQVRRVPADATVQASGGTAGAISTAPVVLALSISYEAGVATLYINAVQRGRAVLASTGLSDATASLECRIGRGLSTGLDYWLGDIRRIQAYHAAHDAATVAALSAWLAAQHGVSI